MPLPLTPLVSLLLVCLIKLIWFTTSLSPLPPPVTRLLTSPPPPTMVLNPVLTLLPQNLHNFTATMAPAGSTAISVVSNKESLTSMASMQAVGPTAVLALELAVLTTLLFIFAMITGALSQLAATSLLIGHKSSSMDVITAHSANSKTRVSFPARSSRVITGMLLFMPIVARFSSFDVDGALGVEGLVDFGIGWADWIA